MEINEGEQTTEIRKRKEKEQAKRGSKKTEKVSKKETSEAKKRIKTEERAMNLARIKRGRQRKQGCEEKS